MSRSTTGHELRADSRFSRFPGRGRLSRPITGAHTRREATVQLPLARKCLDVGGVKPSPSCSVGFCKLVIAASRGHKLRTTSHPITNTTHQLPRPRTRRGRHLDPPLGREITADWRSINRPTQPPSFHPSETTDLRELEYSPA